MNTLLITLARHGYIGLAVAAFLEAIGLPVPAALALAAAGAGAAAGVLNPVGVIAVGVVSIVAGDVILFFVGRKTGWWLLGILCRLSANPESCILLSAESFYKRGRTTLVIAKFLPAINTMAPPLAGSMRMRTRLFLWLDTLGSLLYVVAYAGAGYIFSDFVAALTRTAAAAGRWMEAGLLVAIVTYAIYHGVLYWKNRVYRIVPRVQVEEVAQQLQENPERVLIADVRSHGYYDADGHRIAGSERIEPHRLAEIIQELPREKDIYLYCT